MSGDDFALGRGREREAIVAYLRHAATTHGLSNRCKDPLTDILKLFADRVEGGWHCTTSMPAIPSVAPQATSTEKEG